MVNETLHSHKRYTITVTLLEDLHSGTGTGKGGGIDAVLIRDRAGKPIIRSTHFKGLIREAAKEIIEFKDALSNQLENADAKKHKEKVQKYKIIRIALLGDEGPEKQGALLVYSLRYDNSNDTKKSIIWISTSREPMSRVPNDDTLRIVEYVPAGVSFEGKLEIRLSKKQLGDLKQKKIEGPELDEFLEQCLNRINSLGSHRNRGDGLISMEIIPDTGQPQNAESSAPSRNSGEKRLRILLKNDEPLVLPKTGSPGNIIESEHFIRGQVLFGVFAGWASQYSDNFQLLSILFQQSISFGNAYPLPESDDPTTIDGHFKTLDVAPLPLSYYSEKPGYNQKSEISEPQQNNIPWWAKPQDKYSLLNKSGRVDRLDIDDNADETGLKRPKGSVFLFRHDSHSPWVEYFPKTRIHMRNQVPKVRLDESDKGSLFSTEEILEDTFFLADILFENEGEIEQFFELFKPVLDNLEPLRIGRSGRPAHVVKYEWANSSPNRNCHKTPGKLRVTLESDIIVRADNLGFITTLSKPLFKNLLLDYNQWEEIKSKNYSDYETVYGFNAASGLPRPPMLAIRRGSTIQFDGEDNAIQNLCEALKAKTMLGERVWEGFGRFRLDWLPLEDEYSEFLKHPEPELDFEEREYILQESKKIAESIRKVDKDKLPTSSQWNQLLNRIRITDSDGLDQVFEDLKDHSEKRAGNSWKVESCFDERNGNEQLVHFLCRRYEDLKNDQKTNDMHFYFETMIRWYLALSEANQNNQKDNEPCDTEPSLQEN